MPNNPPKNNTPDKALAIEDWQWLADQLRAWPEKRVHPERTMCDGALRPMAAAVIESALSMLYQPQHGGLVEADNATIQFVSRYGGRCRECADNDGICSNGLPRGGETLVQFIRRIGGVVNTDNAAKRFGWTLDHARSELRSLERAGVLNSPTRNAHPTAGCGGAILEWKLSDDR